MSAVGLTADPAYVSVGIVAGLTYALLGCGLVLVHRASGVINLAHAQIGALGAAVLTKLVIDAHWSLPAALGASIATGAMIGAVVELVVIRRLFTAPRVVVLVATIGVAEMLLALQAGPVSLDHPGATGFPAVVGGSFTVAGLFVRAQDVLIVVAIPLIVIALAALLRRTPVGLDVEACAANPEAAALAGVSVRRVSTTVWVTAAVLATAAAILTGPYQLVTAAPTQALDQGLLLKALTAAMVGRFVSLRLTVVGGLGVGVVEAMVRANVTDPEVVDIVLFAAVLAVVLVRASSAGLSPVARTLVPRLRAAATGIAAPAWMRRLPLIAGASGVAAGIAMPFAFPSAPRIFLFSHVLVYALIALSVTVLTGWAGQLSLGQTAFSLVAASMMSALTLRGLSFETAAVYSLAAAVLLAVAVGLPALRAGGLLLSLTTLGFAIATSAAIAVLLRRHGILSDTTIMTVRRPVWGPVDLADQRTYYLLCLVLLAAAAAAVSRLHRSGIGRALVAVRDNETNAAVFTISPARAKLTAFAISGALAAMGGVLLAGLETSFGATVVPADESLRVIAIAVVGGLGSVAGTILGAAYVIGLPALFDNALEERLITSGAGLLVMLLYIPGGFISLLHQARDALLSATMARSARASTIVAADERAGGRPMALPATVANPVTADPLPGAPTPPVTEATDDAANAGPPGLDRGAHPRGSIEPGGAAVPALRVTNATVRFDGRVALDSVSVTASQGETVGIMGTNGAGKTTLMNVISGLVGAAGSVEVLGGDVSRATPAARARSGLGRAFQNARLFAGMTVTECVEVAMESRERSEVVPSLLALPPSLRAERRKRAAAAEIIDLLSLGRWRDALVAELSTGTRRIVELACLIALEPAVLLLDEPTSGIAQREAEAFGPLITSIRSELGSTVVIIEHDMPLLLSISDRVYCLAAGRVIAEGSPTAVRAHPRVISSYLGIAAPPRQSTTGQVRR